MRATPIAVRFPEPLLHRLDTFAAQEGLTVSAVIRKAVRLHLDHHGYVDRGHLTDDDVLAGIRSLMEHGPHVLSAGEVITRIKEMVL